LLSHNYGSLRRSCAGLGKIVWNISRIDLRVANPLLMKKAVSKLETANRSGIANQGVHETNRTFKTHIGIDNDAKCCQASCQLDVLTSSAMSSQ